MSNVISTTARRSANRAVFLWVISLALVVVASIAIPAFRSPVSVNSFLAALAPILLISIGQGIVILYGGIDLSVGAIAGLSTVVVALHTFVPGGAPAALLLAVLAGAVIGIANGLGVVAGINPLLMTFAMAGVIQGAALLLQRVSGAETPFNLVRTLSTAVGPVPLLVIVALTLLVLAWFWISQSRMGRVIQASGFDGRIASRLGFPVRRASLVAFGLSGMFAALGGLAMVSRTFAADALVGRSSVIDSVAVVLVAGIVITGGVGSLLSVLPAALVIAFVGQIITLTGTDAYYQTIFKGFLLIAAMGIYQVAGNGIRTPWRVRRQAIDREGARSWGF